MFKKIITTTLLGVSALSMVAANAATNDGIYVTGQAGYMNTHMGSKTNFPDIFSSIILDPSYANKNLSNNGLAGRIAIGYQFNQNFAVEAGYLKIGERKVNVGSMLNMVPTDQANLKLQQNAMDLVGKGILPIGNNFNVYGKLGVAYVTTNIKGSLQIPGLPNIDIDLNNTANMVKHTWAPEAAIGVSYDITPQLSIDTSWTHIQPIKGGKNKPGNMDFAAVGMGYSFG